MHISVSGAAVQHNRGTVLGVIPEVERSAAAGHMYNILSMENIIGSRRRAAYHHLFLYPETISVIFEFRCSASLAHLLELTSLLPGIGPSAVPGWIANHVAGHGVGRRRVDTQLLKTVFSASIN